MVVARPEKLGGKAVSEDMGPLVRVATDAGAFQRGLGDHGNRATGGKADVWRQRAQKQPATRRRRAAMVQVGDGSCANVWRHRHPRSLPTLGANEDLAASPVDIIQGEGGDLVGPQPEPGQHHEDGVVPPPQCHRPIATIDHLLNLRGGQVGRQARELPSPNGRHAASQSARAQSSMMEVSQKCPQRPAHRLPGRRAPIPSVALNVTGDVFLADLPELAGAGGAHLTQEPADDRQVADGGLQRQTAFPYQIVAELREYLVLRSDRRQCRRRDRARAAQHGQQPLQRRPIARLDGLLPRSAPKVPLDRAFIEIGQR